MNDAQLKIIFNALDNASPVLNKMKDKAQEVSGSISNTFAQAKEKAVFAMKAISVGVAALGGIGIKAAANFETLGVALRTSLGGSQAKADEAMKTIKTFAAQTPYALEDVTDAFIKLNNYGLNPSIEALKAYGNTASAMGKPLNQMIEAVADAATGQFERLKEFGVKSKQIGDNVEFTFRGVTTTVSKNSKDIENYLIKLGQANFGGGMEAQSKTLTGLVSTLKDTWGLAMVNIYEKSGLLELAKNNVIGLINIIPELEANVLNLIEAFKFLKTGEFKGGIFDLNGASDFVVKVQNVHKQIGILKTKFDILKQATEYIFSGNVNPNLFGLSQDKIDKIQQLRDKFVELKGVFDIFISNVLPVFNQLFEFFTTNILPILVEKFEFFTTNILPVLIELFNKIKDEVIPALLPIILQLFDIWANYLNPAFEKIVKDILPVLTELFNYFIQNVFPSLVEAINQVLPVIKDMINLFMDIWNFLSPVLIPLLIWIGKFFMDVFVIALDVAVFAIKALSGAFIMAWDVIKFVLNAFDIGVNVAISGITGVFSNFLGFFKNLFAGKFGEAVQSLIDMWLAFPRAIVQGINVAIRAFNGMKIAIPDWVPAIGGQNWSPNIPEIPAFAKGTPFVNKTGLATIHQGEAIIPAEANTFDKFGNIKQSESKVVNLNITISGNIYGTTDYEQNQWLENLKPKLLNLLKN